MWIVIVILILLAAGYGAKEYFMSGKALEDYVDGGSVQNGCVSSSLGCVILVVIAIGIVYYIVS